MRPPLAGSPPVEAVQKDDREDGVAGWRIVQGPERCEPAPAAPRKVGVLADLGESPSSRSVEAQPAIGARHQRSPRWPHRRIVGHVWARGAVDGIEDVLPWQSTGSRTALQPCDLLISPAMRSLDLSAPRCFTRLVGLAVEAGPHHLHAGGSRHPTACAQCSARDRARRATVRIGQDVCDVEGAAVAVRAGGHTGIHAQLHRQREREERGPSHTHTHTRTNAHCHREREMERDGERERGVAIAPAWPWPTRPRGARDRHADTC